MLCAQGIEVEEASPAPEDATRYGKGFAVSGGVTGAVTAVLRERGEDAGVRTQKCNGADECRKALMLLKAGKLPVDFLEGMFCVGGCMGGPATLAEIQTSKKVFDTRLDGADNVTQNVESKGLDKANVHRHS